MNQLQSDETIQKESSTSTISDRDLKILKKMRAISKYSFLIFFKLFFPFENETRKNLG